VQRAHASAHAAGLPGPTALTPGNPGLAASAGPRDPVVPAGPKRDHTTDSGDRAFQPGSDRLAHAAAVGRRARRLVRARTGTRLFSGGRSDRLVAGLQPASGSPAYLLSGAMLVPV